MQIDIKEAQQQLARLTQLSLEGEEIAITKNEQPIAHLQAIKPTPLIKKRQLGSLKGFVQSVDNDFDKPIKDFQDYISNQ